MSDVGSIGDRRSELEDMIERLDPAIFAIESQTSENDRVSFLRLQRFMRHHDAAYCYLEIGSHLGGSLLPYLADPRCAWAVSIDPRPLAQPDERGPAFAYRQNSTEAMISGLRAHLPEAALRKLQTFDADAASVPRQQVTRSVQLALIDGEHTNVAAFSDFMSVYPLLAADAVIVYHDANLVADSVRNAERFLTFADVPFRTVFLGDVVAAIGLRGMAEKLVAEVGGAALERDSFIALSRKQVWTSVAAQMLASGELDMPEVARLSANRIKSLVNRLHAIETHPLYRASRPLRAVLSRLKRG